jgi:hypothetical protein
LPVFFSFFPWRDGTTHILFEPLDFIARLVALVPKPRVNLTRFHGVFAPNSKHRALVTPAQRGKGRKAHRHKQGEEKTPFERRVSMTWAQRLKREWNIIQPHAVQDDSELSGHGDDRTPMAACFSQLHTPGF